MDSRFEKKEVDNILRVLNDEDTLYVIGLSLAANGLITNLEAIKRIPDSENLYFFVTSLSIVRELAKLIAKMDGAQFLKGLSVNSKNLLDKIKKELTPFEGGSLVKDTLKPLRDITFHYDYNYSKSSEPSLISGALSELKANNAIEVGFVKDGKSALEQRYTYADKFRSNIVNQLLNKDLVSRIADVSVNIVSFVDSLLADLKNFNPVTSYN